MKPRKTLTNLFMVWLVPLLVVCASQAVPLGTAFTYQGRLIDANQPADGLYDFQFKLYDANVGGNKVSNDVNTQDVDVIDGYFTVALDFGSNVFDGNAVWVEIGIRPGNLKDPNTYTTLSPRQEITPAPYALYTTSGPVVPVPLILIGSQPGGPIIHGQNSSTANLSRGVVGEVIGMSGFTFGLWGESSSPDGTGVYGFHAASTGTQPGIRGATKSASNGAIGVSGIASADSGATYGILGESQSEIGTGVRGWAKATSGQNYGVYGQTSSDSGTGVYGMALSNSGSTYGVYGHSNSAEGTGVFGAASNMGDVTNYGGYFRAWGSLGRGVYGEAPSATDMTNYGGYFQAAGEQGQGVYGKASNAGDVENYGGYFKAEGKRGRGVYGDASNSEGTLNYGGYFTAAGSSGRGVYASASGTDGQGVNASASGTYGLGVYAVATGDYGTGVYGHASKSGDVSNCGGFFKADGEQGQGVYGYAANTGETARNFGGYFRANGGNSYGCYARGGHTGVYGEASEAYSTIGGSIYGGYFKAAGSYGNGVYAKATGIEGRGVFGEAVNSEAIYNYGGYFRATGSHGRGVYGWSTGNSGIGVESFGMGYDFYATGPGTNYGSSSSIRWKRNIQVIDNPLNKILCLRGVYFDWDAEHGGGHDVGMVAEEVGKVLPEIVEYEENGIDATGMDYSKLTPLLVEAVKALNTKAESQKEQLAEKDAEIASLKRKIDDMEGRLMSMESVVAKMTGLQERAR